MHIYRVFRLAPNSPSESMNELLLYMGIEQEKAKIIGILTKSSDFFMSDPVLRTKFPRSFLKKSIVIRLFWLFFTLHVAIVFRQIFIGR
jgi:hypothetical protein